MLQLIRRQSTLAAKLALPQLRTGTFVKVGHHPDADNLFVSSIRSGAKDYTVVSGLRKFYSKEELEGAHVAMIVNLKPTKLRGVVSEAMILAATNEDYTKVELVRPSSESLEHEILRFENAFGDLLDTSQDMTTLAKNIKSKMWRSIQENLRTDSECQVGYHDTETGNIFKLVDASGSPCKVDTIVNGVVS